MAYADRGGRIQSSEDIKSDPNKFDLRTHYWDATGKLTKKDLYTCYVRNGISCYERPLNSGNLWYDNNQPAGRIELGKDPAGKTIKIFNHEAEHIAYVAPSSASELEVALHAERAKAAELEAELASIRAERAADVKTPASAGPTVGEPPTLKARKD